MKKICVYVSSFDGYSDLWDTFFYIFDHFWWNCTYPIYLVNNKKSFSHDKVEVIHTGDEKCWFDRTIRSLERLDEDYVLFMLEDYFISKPIDETIIDEIVELMEEKSFFFVRLSKSEIKKSGFAYQRVPSSSGYPISLQPAIWNRKKLIRFLYEIKGESPWDFEYYFNNCSFGKEQFVPGVLNDNRDVLGYRNGVLRGKWIPSTLRYYKKLGIAIDTSNRKVLSLKESIRYTVANLVSITFPKRLKKSIKTFLSKINFNYI